MTHTYFERYVAIGDSSTEGLNDHDGCGGFRGWANRLAEHISEARGAPLLYANLAIRGRRTPRILDEQLARAVAMKPDLATVFAGTTDMLARRFDPTAVADNVRTMHRALIGTGAKVLTFTMPDLGAVMPLARFLDHRLRALNHVLREAAAATGAILVDFAKSEITSDHRLWSEDRIHANSEGHTRIAGALAEALDLAISLPDWSQPLPKEPRASLGRRIAAELAWTRHHLIPWIIRHSRGRSSGDGVQPKIPDLRPFEAHFDPRAAKPVEPATAR